MMMGTMALVPAMHGRPCQARPAVHPLGVHPRSRRSAAASRRCAAAMLQPGGSIPDAFRRPATFSELPVELPAIGVGTMSWGDPRRGWGVNFNSTDLREAVDILQSGGVTMFDTSEVYGFQGGRLLESSEQLLSSMIATSQAPPPLVSTKFMPVPWTNLLVGGGLRLGRRAVVEAARNSISRLGIGNIASNPELTLTLTPSLTLTLAPALLLTLTLTLTLSLT